MRCLIIVILAAGALAQSQSVLASEGEVLDRWETSRPPTERVMRVEVVSLKNLALELAILHDDDLPNVGPPRRYTP